MSWFCSSVISPHNVISPHKQGSFDFSRARLGMRMSLPSSPARGCWGTGKDMVSSLPVEANFYLRPSFAARRETRMKLALENSFGTFAGLSALLSCLSAQVMLRKRSFANGLETDDPNFLLRLVYEQIQRSVWSAIAAGSDVFLRLLTDQPWSFCRVATHHIVLHVQGLRTLLDGRRMPWVAKAISIDAGMRRGG
jgi:hypothetical protein